MQPALSAYQVILNALVRGEAIARTLPSEHAELSEQMRRSLRGAFLGFVDGASLQGAERESRLSFARAEAGEAASRIAAARALALTPSGEPERVVGLLDRFSSMLGRLSPIA